MDYLVIPFLFLLAGGIVLTFKTRFIQFRAIPVMIKLFFTSLFQKDRSTEHTIKVHRALFTAMATSMGIGNIVAPVVAIGFGGPGALIGFLIASVFGAATAFSEVSLALSYRKELPDGRIAGGPMQYLRTLHPYLALLYAVAGSIMVISWSGKQANTLAVELASYNVPTYLTGMAIACVIAFILFRGIKLISNIAEKIVPLKFFLYAGAMSYVLYCNAHNIPGAIKTIFWSAFSPEALAGAGIGVGLLHALRWGLSEATFANEAGVGTITIPHSMAATKNPVSQGILSMLSVYTSGFLTLLSGLAIISTGIWQSPGVKFDITLVADVLRAHFSYIGPIMLLFIVVIFAFTTILGNSYNGSQFFLYVTKNRWIRSYYAAIALIVFFSSILDAGMLWKLGGYFIVPVAVPNIIGVVILAFKRSDLLKKGF